ncbi:hypothetical protein [Cardinium endosymbiont of Nabis limbatus]|uniref:hypothetical protein n=1 Tax=Cardinium endosymbiont of Nabis limbatus TaxID=3066217 RepID=UPI003AF3EFFA
MLYKKISLPLLPFTCLLLAGCPGNNSSSSSSSTTEDSNKVNDNQLNSRKPALSILSSELKLQASLSCKEGAEKFFLFPCKTEVSNIDVDGNIAFIGVPAGVDAQSSFESAIKENSVKDKPIQLCDNGCFIYWTNLDNVRTGKGIIRLDEKIYNLLASSDKYDMHMAYLPEGASAKDAVFSVQSCKIDTKENDLLILPWENVGLKAVERIKKQVDNGTAYFLKGTASNTDLLSDETNTKMGFILVEQEKLSNIYDWVQTVITSENGWPTEAMQFSEGIIVPGKFRTTAPHIVADLSPQDQPIQKGKYTMLCYLIQDNQHYYLSQMEHVMGDATEETPSKPPTIEFDGSTHGLQVVDLKLVRDKTSDQVKSVKFSEGAKIEYSVNGQVEALPANLQSALLFVPKGTIWRTSILESLFKALQESDGNASITDDRSILLIADPNKPLDPSFTDFFNGTDYQYFACLFSKENNKLHFYTQKEVLSIEDKVAINKPQPQPVNPKPEEAPKSDVLKDNFKK